MAQVYRNVHGRRGTRGVRPWILVPKVLAVAVFLGGLAAALAMLLTSPSGTAGELEALRGVVGRVFKLAIVPALIAAFVLGGLLVLQHPMVLLRQRWLQVKLALALTVLPALHLLARGPCTRWTRRWPKAICRRHARRWRG